MVQCPPKFGLGEALVEAGRHMGVEVEVVNRDLEHDGSNLLHDEPYKSDLQQAKAGESHGFHSGFR